MEYYKISVEEVNKCSELGIVAIWSNEYECPVIVKNDLSTEHFGGHEIVIIVEKEEEKEVELEQE